MRPVDHIWSLLFLLLSACALLLTAELAKYVVMRLKSRKRMTFIIEGKEIDIKAGRKQILKVDQKGDWKQSEVNAIIQILKNTNSL